MTLDHVAEIITAAGAGPLAFLALGLLVLAYVSLKWFGKDHVGVRLSIFAVLLILICMAPFIIKIIGEPSRAADAKAAPANMTEAADADAPAPAERARTVSKSAREAPSPGPTNVPRNDEGPRPVTRFEQALKDNVFRVYFELDRSDLAPSEAAFLDDVADEFSRRNASSVAIEGHTDRWGSASYNAGITQRRADAVKAFLVSRGVPEGAISTQAFGESRPVVQTADNVAEARNRRAEIRFR